MNRDLGKFITILVTRAVLPAVLLVAGVAFITLPYTLGHHPGEARAAQPTIAAHMT